MRIYWPTTIRNSVFLSDITIESSANANHSPVSDFGEERKSESKRLSVWPVW